MIPLKIRLQKRGIDVSGPKQFGRRGFNTILRNALVEAANFWVRNFKPRHFDANASRRYHFARRSAKYQAKKERLAQHGYVPMRLGNSIVIVQGSGFIPQDLVYTGAMRDIVLGSQQIPRATVTASRQRVKVPVPLGHPVQAQTAYETTKLLQAELEMMHRIAFDSVNEQIKRLGAENVEAA